MTSCKYPEEFARPIQSGGLNPKAQPYPVSDHSHLVFCREMWLEAARRAFADIDSDGSGTVSSEELVAHLRAKLPACEVDTAVEDALVHAGYAGRV